MAGRFEEEAILKIGDQISFEIVGLPNALSGHLGAEEVLGSRVFVVADDSISPASSASFQDCVFRVCPMFRYSSKRAYEKFLEKVSKDLKRKADSTAGTRSLDPGGSTIASAISRTGSMNSLVSYMESVDNGIDPEIEKELSELKAKAEQEERQNKEEMEQLQGTAGVAFGMGIQLQHVKTNKFLTRTLESCETEKENMRFILDEEGSKKSHFMIMPVHKMRSNGEPVRIGDQVHLVSLRNHSEFLHISETLGTDGFHEANLSLNPTKLKLNSFASHVDVAVQENLKAGDVIFLFHKEREGFLSVPTEPEMAALDALNPEKQHTSHPSGGGKSTDESNPFNVTALDHARAMFAIHSNTADTDTKDPVSVDDPNAPPQQPVPVSRPSTAASQRAQEILETARQRVLEKAEIMFWSQSDLFVHRPPKGSTTVTNSGHIWLVEKELTSRGGAISFHQHVRLKHVASGQYLCIQEIPSSRGGHAYHVIGMTMETGPESLFAIVPLLKKSSEVTFDSLIRIRHAIHDHLYLHAKSTFESIDGEGKRLADTDLNHKFFKVIATEMHQEDVFGMHRVPRDHVQALNHVFTTIPVFKAFLDDCAKLTPSELDKRTEAFEQAISQLILFMTDSDDLDPMKREGIPITVRQDFIRECGALNMMQQILHLKSSHEEMTQIAKSEDCASLKRCFRLIYRAIKQLCKANPSNALYVSDRLEFLQAQMGYEMKSADTFMEIFRSGSLDLLLKLPQSIIQGFFTLLRKSSRARYLTMLATACTCNNEPVPTIQVKIGKCLLEDPENRKILMMLDLDSVDGKATPVVRWNNNTSKSAVAEFSHRQREKFIEGKSKKADETRFLEEQIGLFAALSKGRNEVLTQHMRTFIDAKVLESCIMDPNVHHDLRARCCDLLANLFIDNQPHMPMRMIEHSRSIESIGAPPKRASTSSGDFLNFALSSLNQEADSVDELISGGDVEPSQVRIKLTPEFYASIESVLNGVQSQTSLDVEKNGFILSLVSLLCKMVKFGFYASSKNTVDRLMKAILKVLDGRSDEHGHKRRYVTNEKSLLIQNAKLEACKVLHHLFDMKINHRVSVFLAAFESHRLGKPASEDFLLSNLFQDMTHLSATTDTNQTEEPESQQLDEPLISPTNDAVNSSNSPVDPLPSSSAIRLKSDWDKIFDCLSDLVKYEYKPLSTEALKLLTRTYTQREELWEHLRRVELMDSSQMQLAKVLDAQIQYLTEHVVEGMHENAGEAEKCILILADILAVIRDPQMRTLYQRLLVNMGMIDLAIDKLLLAKHSGWHQEIVKEVLRHFADVLQEMAVRNHKNQELLFQKLKIFKDHFGERIGMAPLIQKVFQNNRTLCLKVDSALIGLFLHPVQAYKIYNPLFLSFLKSVVEVEGVPIPGNQALVMKAMTDRFKDIVEKFTKPHWFSELSALIPQNIHRERPWASLVLYYTSLLEVYAFCASGKNHATEVKCQQTFALETLIPMFFEQNSKNLYSLLSAVLKLIDEAYINTERPVQVNLELLTTLVCDVCSRVIHFADHLAILKSQGESIKEKQRLDWEAITTGIHLDPSGEKLPLALSGKEQVKVQETVEVIEYKEREQFTFEMALPFVQHFVDSEFVNRADTLTKDHLCSLKDALDSLIDLVDNVSYKRMTSQCMSSLVAHSFSGSELNNRKSIIALPTAVKSQEAKAVWNEFMDFVAIVRKSKDAASVFGSLGKLLLSKNLTKQLIDLCSRAKHVTDDDVDELHLLTQAADVLVEVIQSKVSDAQKNAATLKKVKGSLDVTATKQQHTENVLKRVQRKLADEGAVSMALQYIESGQDDLVKHGLQLAIALLECEGSNRSVQKLFYLKLQKKSANVFSELESRLSRAEAEVKDRKTMFKKMKDVYEHIAKLPEDQRETAMEEVREELAGALSNSSCITHVLRFMQLLCEGHYADMQEYFSSQDRSSKSINLVMRVLDYVCTLEKYLDDTIAVSASQAFCMLTEVMQGPCVRNQAQLGVSSLYLCANSLLFYQSYKDVTDQNLVLDLKNKVVITLLSLFEGGKNPHIPRSMLKILDIDGLFRLIDKTITDNSFEIECLNEAERLKKIKATDRRSLQQTGSDSSRLSQLGKWPETFEQMAVENRELRTELKLNAFILLSSLTEEDNQNEIKRNVIDPQHAHVIRKEHVVPGKKAKGVPPKLSTMQEAINYKFSYDTAWQEIRKEIGRVEIERADSLERVYFRIPKICKHLSKQTKENFVYTVDQDVAEKIQDFVEKSDILIYQMHHNHRLSKSWLRPLFTKFWAIQWLCYVLSLAINLLVCASLIKPGILDDDGRPVVKDQDGRFTFWLDSTSSEASVGIGWALFAIEVLNLFVYFMRDGMVQHKKIELQINAAKAHQLAKYPGKRPWWLRLWDSKQIGDIINLSIYAIDAFTLYHLTAIVFAILGLFMGPAFFCFHIFNLFIGSRYASSVIQAVTKNGIHLIVTALLGVAVMWIFSLIAFIFFNDQFMLDLGNNSSEPVCQSAASCFLFIVDFGIRGNGFWEGSNFPYDSRPWRTTWNIAFVVAINIILLNMIFGIIIDTFSELREEKANLQERIESRCFICNVEKVKFDRYANGLDAHQKNEHNIWHYLYFMVCLREVKEVSEFTGTEHYVYEMLQKKDYSFFPQNKALVLMRAKKENFVDGHD